MIDDKSNASTLNMFNLRPNLQIQQSKYSFKLNTTKGASLEKNESLGV